jgi:hypothetical protein
MSDEIPTLAEELERKTVEELERIVRAITNRAMTYDRGDECLLTLWNTASGLVSRDTMDVIARTQAAVGHKRAGATPVDELGVYSKSGNVAVVMRIGATVSLRVMGASEQRKDFPAPATEVHPCKWASERFDAVVKQLAGAGFLRVW